MKTITKRKRCVERNRFKPFLNGLFGHVNEVGIRTVLRHDAFEDLRETVRFLAKETKETRGFRGFSLLFQLLRGSRDPDV